MISQAFLSDFSRSLLTSLGDKPPTSNDREEAVMGRLFT
jgi:hypothetical protein